jgi:hypothetical protein
MACIGAVAVFAQGNSFPQGASSGPAAEAQPAKAAEYDDHQVSRIQRGKTTEAQALEWFGAPELRDMASDGRSCLGWSWGKSRAGGGGGSLTIRFSSDGKAESYSARSYPPAETRTLEFAAESEKELRARMAEWQQEGWKVLSVSKPLPQKDGVTKRKAQLSRDTATKSAIHYDDQVISRIRRGETTESQLLEWFGPANSRELHSDGRLELQWKLGDWSPGSGNSGQLATFLDPEGKLSSYLAKRGP